MSSTEHAQRCLAPSMHHSDQIYMTPPLRDPPLRDTLPRAGRRDTPFRDIPFRDTPLRAGGRPRNVDQTLGLNHGDIKG